MILLVTFTLFWIAAAVSVYLGKLSWPPLVLGYLVAINLLTITLYAYDKPAAGRGAMRIPERVLHVLAAMGGTPAAWLGQCWLRHKTQKASFQWTFRTILIVQIVVVISVGIWHVFFRS